MVQKAAPMSRTKCRLSGPVSGTAAGKFWYQLSGANNIHRPLARFVRPNIQKIACIDATPCSSCTHGTSAVVPQPRGEARALAGSSFGELKRAEPRLNFCLGV